MSRSFTGARLKVDRAHKHLTVYEDQVRRFFKSKPYRVSFHFNRKRTEGTFKITMRRPLPQDTFGPLIGDCVHNARSALDHLVWGLAEGFSGPAPDDRETQFPIYEARRYTPSGVEVPFAERAERRIKRLPVFAQALLEQLQPYHAKRPMEHPFILCRDFDDTDKHKLIPVIVAAIQTYGAGWSGGIDLHIVESRSIEGPFENGAEIGWIRFSTPVRSGVKVKPNVTVVETFSDSAPFIDSRHTLRLILNHVARVIDAFEQFPNHRSVLIIPSL